MLLLKTKLLPHCEVKRMPDSMLGSFFNSFLLRATYKANGFIWALKSIPLIKKLLPSTLYASRPLKVVANVFSGIQEFVSIFFWKIVYLLSVFGAGFLMKVEPSDSFAHLFLFLTLIGGLLNTNIIEVSQDKFYAIILMRMDARRYALSNYVYFLLKNIVGMLVLTPFFCLLCKASILTGLLLPLYIVSVKLLFSAKSLYDYSKDKRTIREKRTKIVKVIEVFVLFTAAVVPPYFGFSFAEPVLWAVTAVTVVPAIFAARYIWKFPSFLPYYKCLLRPEAIFVSASGTSAGEAQQKMMQKKISADLSVTSKKTGFAYFNDIFMKRHKKLMTKSAFRLTLVCFALFILCLILNAIYPEDSKDLNKVIMTYLPYFLFLMYCMNRGKDITKAMFLNCDHSMLTYRFYRQPKALLSLFRERLKYVILINLMPAAVVAVALPVLLYVSGGTENSLNYLILFVSILSMSVFFSVHSMVMYYLLQPYNVNLESKSATFGIVNAVTYFVCYMGIQVKVPTLIFGSAITAFCVVYILVALVLAYKLAPKTFRLRN